MRDNKWARLMAYITGSVNQRLLLQYEYLIAQNRVPAPTSRGICGSPTPNALPWLRSPNPWAGNIWWKWLALPNRIPILAWYRRLIACKFDGSKHRAYPGRPRIDPAIEALVVRIARENSSWGYDRIAGAVANLGHHASDQTIGNILKRHGIAPVPKPSQNTTWKEFICAHLAVLAGTDFFTVEVLTWRGIATHYVLFFLHLESRRVTLGGITRHPTEAWITQMARNTVDETSGGFSGIPGPQIEI